MSKTFTVQNLAYSALLIALLSVAAYISIPTPFGVPFTLQLLIVFIISCMLEKKLAALTVVTYIILGLIGLPIFSSGRGGFSYIFSPTFGYLIGFIIGAFILSAIYASPKFKKKIVAYIVGSIFFILIVYSVGIGYFILIKNFYISEPISLVAAIIALSFPFILLDIAKCVLAYFIIIALEKATGKSQRPLK